MSSFRNKRRAQNIIKNYFLNRKILRAQNVRKYSNKGSFSNGLKNSFHIGKWTKI